MNGETIPYLEIPESLQETVWTELHKGLGHLGIKNLQTDKETISLKRFIQLYSRPQYKMYSMSRSKLETRNLSNGGITVTKISLG